MRNPVSPRAESLGLIRRSPRGLALCVVACALTVGSAALAQPTSAERTAAQALFDEARALMERGDTARACPKFEESHRLEPAGGTVLNLAICYETSGKLASAWASYRDALGFAERDRQAERAEYIRGRIESLEDRLPRLQVVIGENARLAQLIIEIDGKPLTAAAAGTAIPVDPGPHEIRVMADGKQTWTTSLVVTTDAPPGKVTVPRLSDASARDDARSDSFSAGRPVVGPLVLAGAGLVLATLGTVFALNGRSDYVDANGSCGASACSGAARDQQQDRLDVAQRDYTLGWVGIGAGAAGLVAGTAWWLLGGTGSSAAPERAKVAVSAAPLPGGAMAGATWRF